MPSQSSVQPPSNFVWYELHTPNPAAVGSFYSRVLGWSVADAGMPGPRYDLLSVAGIPIGGILEKPASAFANGGKPAWLGYIGVDDADRFSERVVAAGGVLHRPAADIPGIGRFAVVADPQGVIFVLFQPDVSERQPTRPAPGAPGSAAWHDLIAISWEPEFDFYAGLFGWSKSDAVNMGPNGIYQIFAAGTERLGGMMTRMDPSMQPAWLFYFHVEEIHAAVTRVTDAGGTVVHGPSVVPGGQQIAHCLDTEGTLFGIVAPAAEAPKEV